jgi:hypothetical protein
MTIDQANDLLTICSAGFSAVLFALGWMGASSL